jgi:thiamine-monophosphate kinase
MGEFALIDRIRRRTRPMPGVLLGIGDDCALVESNGSALAISIDTLNAGVHFPLDASPRDIGHKALAVNLSDLAAMGARPQWATLSLSLPKADPAWLDAFCDGFFALADAHQLALIGGDTVRGPLAITVQIAGQVDPGRALKRSAGQVGDTLWLSGTIGDAALGLKAHKTGRSNEHPTLTQRLHRPTPRVALGERLLGLARAAIDVSDGLLADLTHLAKASKLGATLSLSALPTHPAARHFCADDDYALRLAQLSGGDDYELLFSAPDTARADIEALSAELELPLTRIGALTDEPAVIVLDADGRRFLPALRGFDHFA